MEWREGLSRLLSSVAADNISGASKLAERALEEMLDLLEIVPEADVQEAVRLWAIGLTESQPSMAPMYTMGRRLTDECLARGWGRSAVMKAFYACLERLRKAPLEAARMCLGVLRYARDIVTYSRSSQVILALKEAREWGGDFFVKISEGRPMLEGVEAARELASLGLRVRLVVDAALPLELEGADLLLVGADAVGPSGLVNKVGTRTLVSEARRLKVPAYAICTSDKWLRGEDESRLRIEEKAPSEVLKDPPAGVEVSNRYFDRTPLGWFTGFINENGIWASKEIKGKMGV
jgi:translation initiation factor 2B subunit (eIF-2B alpha/beta/delta family)